MTSPSPASRGFLAPEVLTRLGTLELKARAIVEGLIHGLHRSPYRGFSIEFAEYRQYMPGDDLGTIDWKVYARADRYCVKKFEQETNVQCHILLDASASMSYGSQGVTKLEYGAWLAAALAFLMYRQRDAVGLTAFDGEAVTTLPPSGRPGQLKAVLVALERLRPGRQTDVSKPLTTLAEVLQKRGLVVVISDLLDDPARVLKGMRYVKARGMEVLVFHVLDRAELTFPFQRAARFRDLETDVEVLAQPSIVRDGYLREMRALTARYEQELRLNGIDYALIDSSRPVELALMSYLETRRRRF